MSDEKLKTLVALARDAGHTLNNCLSVISVNFELITGRLIETEERIEARKDFRAAVRRMREETAMLTSLDESPRLVETNLSYLLEKHKRNFRSFIRENINLTFELKNSPTVFTNPWFVLRIVDQLILNAQDAILEKGFITVRVCSLENFISDWGKFVVISVLDSGRGMDVETKSKIFQNFSTKGRGRGSGLCIVKDMVELCRARIEVESRKDQGTIFQVFFPITNVFETSGKNTEDHIAAVRPIESSPVYQKK